MTPREIERRRQAERDRLERSRDIRTAVLFIVMLLLALSVGGAPPS